jgi:GNAT superfamily N-acetyltransferase
VPVPVVTTYVSDGTCLRLRIGTPEDVAELLAGFERFSDESRYKRFFTAKPHLTEPMLEHLVAVDRERHVAIGAFDPACPSPAGGEDGAGIGVVRVIRETGDAKQAEFSISVVDDYQHRGVGRVLMEAAAVVADRLGIVSLHGTVLAENLPMRRLALSLGATQNEVEDAAVLEYEVDVAETLAALPADRRQALESLW